MTSLNFPAAPSNGDTYDNFIYDSAKGVWKLQNLLGNDLDNLNDVTIDTPTTGQALTYDGTEWTNATPATTVSSLTDTVIYEAVNGQVLLYDGADWINGNAAGGVEVSATAPSSPSVGDLWWDSDNGNMYVYYNDGDSSQWVAANGPQVFVGAAAPAGYQGQMWFDSSTGKMYVFYDDGTSSQWVSAIGGSIAGTIVQVVSTTKTDVFTMSSTTFTTLTGLTATITPRSTSSKILVMVDTNGSASNSLTTNILYRLMRDSTELAIGDASGNKTRVTFGGNTLHPGGGTTNTMRSVSMSVLDSPSTTSSITYSVDIAGTQATAIYVNRAYDESDTSIYVRGASTITLMEVAG
jgi:hypothetical protein